MTPRAAKRKDEAKPVDPDRLVREQAGRYRSGDGRFTVESDAAGVWFVVDAERTNEFGLPQMTGPYATLADARAAMVETRSAPPVAPLVPFLKRSEDAAERRAEPRAEPGRRRAAKRPSVRRREKDEQQPEESGEGSRVTPRRTAPAPPPKPASWLERHEPATRERATRRMRALERLGIPDPERLVRAEIEGAFPHVVTVLLAHRLSREAIETWRTDPTWIDDAALPPPGEAAPDVSDALRRILDAGVSRDDVARLAEHVALKTTAKALGVVTGPLREGAERDLPGWRATEVDEDGEPTGRPILFSEDDLLRVRP